MGTSGPHWGATLVPEVTAGGGTLNLDGPGAFKGTANGDTLRFERDGKPQVLRVTNGEGTGMKWLADKTRCLVVTAGEGFRHE